MTWKTNGYFAATLLALFGLLNFIPSEHDIAVLLGLIFVLLSLVTAVSCSMAAFRSVQEMVSARRRRSAELASPPDL